MAYLTPSEKQAALNIIREALEYYAQRLERDI